MNFVLLDRRRRRRQGLSVDLLAVMEAATQRQGSGDGGQNQNRPHWLFPSLNYLVLHTIPSWHPRVNA
jgi:hypothetical protein